MTSRAPSIPPAPTRAAVAPDIRTIPRQTSRLAVAADAFSAILRRDLLVTRRELGIFLVQMLLQPLFFLFVFGRILPELGFAQSGFAAVLLPGIVAMTIFTTAIQGVALPLVIDLGYAREIEDRLLAPLPLQLVAVEKVVFAALRGLIAGTVIFPLAWLILWDRYHVRDDAILAIAGVMILSSIAAAALGLTLGTIVHPQQIGLMFSLVFAPLLFTGCTYYPWAQLDTIRWFQIVTLFNPLTYASEGLRAAMVPTAEGMTFDTISPLWVVCGLMVTIVAFVAIGVRLFLRRVVS